MQIFYSDNINTDKIVLTADEANHLKNVLRKSVGDKVNVVDGKGNFYEAVVAVITKSEVHLNIVRQQSSYGKKNYYLHIAIAPTKNADRIEWFLEKAVEIGVDEISFLSTARTERKQVNNDRMSKLAIAAMKQSVKAYLPKVNPIEPLKQFISKVQTNNLFIAYLAEGEEKNLLSGQLKPGKDYLILIGPEGDFSHEEIKLCLARGFKPVSLGHSRLRTETAGVYACIAASIINC